MAGRFEVFGRVLVLRAVAAANMAADEAHPQVHPGVPDLDTLLANRNVFRVHIADLVFVRTGFLWHSINCSKWPFGRKTMEGSDSGSFHRT